MLSMYKAWTAVQNLVQEVHAVAYNIKFPEHFHQNYVYYCHYMYMFFKINRQEIDTSHAPTK